MTSLASVMHSDRRSDDEVMSNRVRLMAKVFLLKRSLSWPSASSIKSAYTNESDYNHEMCSLKL